MAWNLVGIDQGYRSDLTGGGLIRSRGGWSAVNALRRQRTVSYIHRICKKENISVEALKSGSRRQKVSAIRSQLARKLIEEWGVSLTETGRYLGVSPSAIAKTLYRLNSHKSN